MKPSLVYLDVCALCRPFDDQGFVRIRLETDAVNLILGKVREGKVKLAVSPVHHAEISAISDLYERDEVLSVLDTFGQAIDVDITAARRKADQLVATGVGVADAAHVAFAEAYTADFITCDDKLLKQCNRIGIATWCGDPVAYCIKENLR